MAMTTFTEIVAALVVHSSAVALSHFGVKIEPTRADREAPAQSERLIARTHAQQHWVVKLTSCPQARHRVTTIKV